MCSWYFDGLGSQLDPVGSAAIAFKKQHAYWKHYIIIVIYLNGVLKFN